MDGLIGFIFGAVILSKIIKAVKGEKKHPEKKANRPVQKTTQAQRDAYYYNQQKVTKERLQQKYATQQKTVSKSDILSRAKENVQENEPDVMEQQIHAEVCREFRDTAHATSDVNIHKELSPLCDTGEESDIIKKINDLMITGYSGDMTFDRDFVAEGVEMLNQFTV